MPLELLFEMGSTAALVGWALMAAAVIRPGHVQHLLLTLGGRLLPLLLALAYAGVLVAHWRSAPSGNFGSLDGVVALFSSRGKLLGGWLDQDPGCGAKHEQREDQPPDPGGRPKGLGEATANATQPTVGPAALQCVQRGDSGVRTGAPRRAQYAGFGARELIGGQRPAALQLVQSLPVQC